MTFLGHVHISYISYTFLFTSQNFSYIISFICVSKLLCTNTSAFYFWKTYNNNKYFSNYHIILGLAFTREKHIWFTFVKCYPVWVMLFENGIWNITSCLQAGIYIVLSAETFWDHWNFCENQSFFWIITNI